MSDTRPKFLTAEWRHLVMLNYQVDPKILFPKVPRGTELDDWNGRTYVSMVGFRFLNTKLLGLPVPFHRNFTEVNLRFYVRRRSGAEWRRGVVFIKEIVPLPAVTFVARWVYNENYVTLPMRHQIDLPKFEESKQGSVAYSWKWRGQWSRLAAETTGASLPLLPGSEEEFISNHFWGYANQTDGSTMEYAVEHPTWRVWRTTSSRLEGEFGKFYNPEIAEVFAHPSSSAFVADGSEIVVRQATRLSSKRPLHSEFGNFVQDSF